MNYSWGNLRFGIFPFRKFSQITGERTQKSLVAPTCLAVGGVACILRADKTLIVWWCLSCCLGHSFSIPSAVSDLNWSLKNVKDKSSSHLCAGRSFGSGGNGCEILI